MYRNTFCTTLSGVDKIKIQIVDAYAGTTTDKPFTAWQPGQ